MGFFMLQCDDLVVDSETALKVAELLGDSISVSENYRTKKYEISGSRNNLMLRPFPAAEVARMQLDLANKREND
jgi:hypothetical protein